LTLLFQGLHWNLAKPGARWGPDQAIWSLPRTAIKHLTHLFLPVLLQYSRFVSFLKSYSQRQKQEELGKTPLPQC
jgi:hypothetical protein